MLSRFIKQADAFEKDLDNHIYDDTDRFVVVSNIKTFIETLKHVKNLMVSDGMNEAGQLTLNSQDIGIIVVHHSYDEYAHRQWKYEPLLEDLKKLADDFQILIERMENLIK